MVSNTAMHEFLASLLTLLALPKVGLSSLFVVSFISATLLPLGSEPALLALLKLNPHLFWAAIGVATLGNTLGGAVTWWMGYGAHNLWEHNHPEKSHHSRAYNWLRRLGPKACLLSWLPFVGDPLCAVAGWMRMSFWPCLIYMSIGKFLRYLTMTQAFLWAFHW